MVWLAAGASIVVMTLRNRAYVKGLPPTKGNLSIKRDHLLFLVLGVSAIGVGLWHAFRYFDP